jgi:hypothetical protein
MGQTQAPRGFPGMGQGRGAKSIGLSSSYGAPSNEQYVFLKLISERTCICCGNSAEDTAQDLELRQRENRCLICGSPRHETEKVVTTTAAMQSKAADAFQALRVARQVREMVKVPRGSYTGPGLPLLSAERRVTTSD